ncbi:forkhead box protein I1c-like [Anomaloglossus baeobatrachus]|uniref:forkhead box protein I1c-like n=1 Tax=Anomaloglossus baeobatrachus TaxID=238106 RepID=UPI003F503DC0
MDSYGQHASSSQPGYFYTLDLTDIEVFTGDYVNLHQQDLHQPQSMSSDYQESNADPYQRFGGSTINPSHLNENGPGYLPSDCTNSQAQVLTPAEYAEPDMPCLPILSHDDVIEIVRPPYSDKALVAMAFQNAPEKKLTLRQICNYLVDHFPSYKSKTKWQKSIRDTLSQISCFKKVARDDRGKGAYWTLDPRCAKTLDNHFKWKWKKCNCSKPSKKLVNKKNVTSLRSDSLVGSPGKLSASPTDDNHNSLLLGESISQVNLPQALPLPNQSEQLLLFSPLPPTCKPNAV